MSIGRNDPCHCGSGKKYKKCHLTADLERSRAEQRISTLQDWVAFYGRSLEETAKQAVDNVDAVADRFFGGRVPEDPYLSKAFTQHVLYDAAEGSKAPIHRVNVPDEIAKAERRQLLATQMGNTHASLLEVVEVKIDRAVRFEDRLTGRRFLVWDTRLARSLQPLEVIIGRVIVFEERAMLLNGWEKVNFRGRKAAIADLRGEIETAGLADDDIAGRVKWLKAEACRTYARVRTA